MEKPFVYGVAVSGDNFTDRKEETRRIRMNFTSGINTIIISPRRMGKTSIVKKVKESIDDPKIKVVLMDIYDCRSEYDFYEKFATSIIKAVAGKVENVMSEIKDILGRVSAKITLSPGQTSEYSISLGLSPKNATPEEILDLPQRIAEKRGIHIVVCIDEFQQVGEFSDSMSVQKRLRTVWQHQRDVSYCIFGSKKHLMERIFQKKNMPFYQFGDMIFLNKISTADWVKYICSRFESKGMCISPERAERICCLVEGYSSYVQQLSWNVMIETVKEVTDNNISDGYEELLNQGSSLFMEQIAPLTSYQMNFLRALSDGIHTGFTSETIMSSYHLGTKSNIARLQKALIDRELVEKVGNAYYMTDPVFAAWFKRYYMSV